MSDDNERLAAGTLPDDPEADTEVMPAPGLPPRLTALLPKAFARMRARKAGDEKPIPLPSAWPTVAAKLHGGLWPGLYVLVGHTGAGKTQWCLQSAIHAARTGTPVLYVALEADDTEFVSRCLGLVADTPWNHLYFGDHPKLEHFQETHRATLETLPLHVLFAPPRGWNYTELIAAAQVLRETYPEPAATPGARPLLVILDFLQIVGAAEPREDLRERIGNAANAAGYVAREENAAVILASSTARGNYDKLSGKGDEWSLGSGPPGRLVGLGKESGDIESSADAVLVLTQEPWPDHTTPPAGGTVCHLAIAKGRKVLPAWVELRFDGRQFTEPPSKEPLRGAPTR